MALSDDEFADLQQHAVSAKETAETLGWAVITDRIKQGIAKRQTLMIGGNVKDWEQYKEFANWLECALWVLRIPDQIMQQVEEHRALRADFQHHVEEGDDPS